jgi:dienelactone hydrolase
VSAAARPLVLLAAVVAVATLAGCGGSSGGSSTDRNSAPAPAPTGPARLSFAENKAEPLAYVDRGRVNTAKAAMALHDVSFRSGGHRIDGYLVLPPGKERRPAVVLVHGSGGDRSELLPLAVWLAARNVVTLTITEPSTSAPPAQATGRKLLAETRDSQVADVVAVRRAVDVLQSLPTVDPRRIGYVGWSSGAKTGTFVAASDPRVKALVLLSAGADSLSAFVKAAPADLKGATRTILGSVDPIRYIALARPGTVLLEDGRRDQIVPHSALLNIVDAAPHGTTVRWYAAQHQLDRAAFHDAFDWLQQKLPIDGPPVNGAPTETSGG